MSATLDLTPSREKIARAERKTEQLTGALQHWASSTAYSIRTQYVDETAYVIARIETPPPDDIAWEMVEATLHLRSALDKVIVALAEKNGKGLSGASFPFWSSAPDGTNNSFPHGRPEKAIKNKLTPEQWNQVLACKPYPGGNDLLAAVNSVANHDKHAKDLVRVSVTLHPHQLVISNGVFVGGSGAALDLGPPDAGTIEIDKSCESVLFSFGCGPGSREPDIESNIAVSVVFGDISAVSGREVSGTLARQVILVRDVVERLGLIA